jgi:trehalose/maltose hydrolase-like predicted phosphorylase
MLEIARFWASIARFNPERERYEIHRVMGPDEFHEKYPGVPESGLRNNAYTNVMVAWLCGIAGNLLSLLPASRAEALRGQLGIDDDELGVVAGHEPPDVRAVPRRRDHQPVRGLRRS